MSKRKFYAELNGIQTTVGVDLETIPFADGCCETDNPGWIAVLETHPLVSEKAPPKPAAGGEQL